MKKVLSLLLLLFVFCDFAMAMPFCIGEPLCIREPENGLYLVKVNTKVHSIHTFAVDSLMKNEDVYNNNNFVAVVNGGYFDFSNKKTVSFVMKDEQMILDPLENEHLSQNESLKPDIDLILNRSEFRVLNCDGEIRYDILKHYDTVAPGCKIVDSLQAGPMIYPKLKSEAEYFVRKNAEGKIIRNAIQTDMKKPRTAVAIKNNNVYFILATKDYPMTLEDLYAFSRKHRFEKVLNLDGGGSNSFNSADLSISSERNNTQRRVKSFLVVE